MNNPGNLTGRLLHNLTIKVTHAQLKKGYSGWNRMLETPTFNRLYFIDKGEGKVIINGVAYFPKPGQLMIMPAGSIQTTETSINDPYTRYFCHFDADIGEWPLFHSANQLYICNVPNPDSVRDIFTQMIDHFQKDDILSIMRNQAILLNLIAICLESSENSNSDFMNDFIHTRDQGKLTKVLHYIDQWLSKPMEIEELAELAHLHPNYFIPYFKKFMGVTPMHYVQLKRMEHAKRQLSYSDFGISEIAEQVGMELAHFSKSFKKTMGLSPSAYRNSTK
ncbi:AraC family transcriptional regulator [Paenibacillus crassostreae]|uniref:AraC family transcriptional regulator n=1 Tax=Paenibacillus crassostreae TaxID=1763538 RepID=A0A167ANW7_9BACL|nr:AraC family transcriptional regulator [Paenibacillus crassostreae]AOZ93723.1 AraC family transcriptional regulator [Paenibacillus crassostreae]OAB71258.1 AraC family transcriptional regulator [Paenibacillus crassostreae]